MSEQNSHRWDYGCWRCEVMFVLVLYRYIGRATNWPKPGERHIKDLDEFPNFEHMEVFVAGLSFEDAVERLKQKINATEKEISNA